MSYILDALRRADAERERGAIPGLHAQPAAAWSTAPAPSGLISRSSVLWAAMGTAGILLGLMLWHFGSTEVSRIAAIEPVTAPAPAMPVIPPGASRVQAPLKQAVEPVRSAEAGAVPVKPVVRSVQPLPVRIEPATPARQPAPAKGVASVKPAAVVSDVKVHTVSELPDDIRRELPTLAIGGSIYSENAANRFLIVNGQIFHETDTLAPGLTLLQIQLKSALLGYKGWRYSITY